MLRLAYFFPELVKQNTLVKRIFFVSTFCESICNLNWVYYEPVDSFRFLSTRVSVFPRLRKLIIILESTFSKLNRMSS